MIVSVTPQHIKQVVDDLSEQTCMEIQAIGIPVEELMPRFLRFMMSSDRAVGHALLDDNGVAICVMAVAEHHGIVSTFLIAGSEFFEMSLKAVRPFRRYMAEMVEKFGPVFVFSRSPHPMAGKWFKLLGGNDCGNIGRDEKVFRWG